MKKILVSPWFRFMWSLSLALLLYFICPPCFSKTSLAIVLGIIFVLVNSSRFIEKVPVITHVARFLVGGLFIFSGFIKANDPLGFSYKLKEYFEVFQNDSGYAFFGWFAHLALALAILICASEIILGVLLLLGLKRDLTLWLLFAQITFFTFLTFYSACYNKVTHCGCFGDFLKLRPWDSFWKDIALMILITLLFAGRTHINMVLYPMVTYALLWLGVVFSFAFPIYAYRNLPPLDFRPYAPGMSIKENMKTPPDYKPAVYVTGFVYENLKTGKREHFDANNYPWQDTLNWKWYATENVLLKEAVNAPKITDFNVTNAEGVNITDSVLNDKNYSFWLIAYDLGETEDNAELISAINDFYKLASQDKIKFMAFTASSLNDVDDFKHRHNALYDFASVDGTVLKTMIRSNPGLMLVKDGKVIMNWHYNNFPVYSFVKDKYLKSSAE